MVTHFMRYIEQVFINNLALEVKFLSEKEVLINYNVFKTKISLEEEFTQRIKQTMPELLFCCKNVSTNGSISYVFLIKGKKCIHRIHIKMEQGRELLKSPATSRVTVDKNTYNPVNDDDVIREEKKYVPTEETIKKLIHHLFNLKEYRLFFVTGKLSEKLLVEVDL